MIASTTSSYLFVALLLFAVHLQCDGQRSPAQKPKTKQTQPQPQTACSQNEFTCGNKKCIPQSAVCNGTSECADGKDEAPDQCLVIKTGTCTSGEQAKSFCDDSFDVPEGSNVTHQFLCQAETVRKNGSVSVACSNGVWTPTSTLCTRICQPIVIQTANITCLRNGKEVNCTEPLLPGTKIRAQCGPYYHASHSEIVCQANGTWNVDTVECFPECGRQLKDKVKNSTSARAVEYREFPWSAAIYYTKPGSTTPIPIQGTIISPYLVVTSAINFDPEYRKEVLNSDSTFVIVAKRTKDPDVTDDQFQSTHKVRDIYFTKNGYQESDNSSTSENIAIIELQEKIIVSPSVYPACVNWANNETLYPNEGTIGQVPHIVTSIGGNTSEHEVLQTVALKYVSRTECLSSDAMKNYPQTVRTDNFCTEEIADPVPGDGAFIFQEPNTNLFFIQGLVDSATPLGSSPPKSINTYVDLTAHIDWIKAVRKHTEDKFISEMWLQVESEDQSTICKKNFTKNESSSVGLRSGFGDEEQLNSTDGCKLPSKNETNASDYVISCDSSVPESKCQKIREEGSTVPEYTMLRIECESGYAANANKDVVCFKNKWTPDITPCRGSSKEDNGSPQQGSEKPIPQRPAIRKPVGTSSKPGSNQQSTQSPATQASGVSQRKGTNPPSQKPSTKKPTIPQKPSTQIAQPPNSQNNNSVDPRISPSSQGLPEQVDYGETLDQDVSPSSQSPIYIRPGSGSQSRPIYRPTQQPGSQIDDGYGVSSVQPVQSESGDQQPVYTASTDHDYPYPSSQPAVYNQPRSGFQTEPSYNQLPVDNSVNQGQGYPSSAQPIYRRPGNRSQIQPNYDSIPPFQQPPYQDYGGIQLPRNSTFQEPQPAFGDRLNQNYAPPYGRPVPGSRPGYILFPGSQGQPQVPINRIPGTDPQIRPDYNPYNQQIPADFTGQGYNPYTQPPVNKKPGNAYQPQPGYTQPTQQSGTQTADSPGLRGSFDSTNEQVPQYQNSHGGGVGQTYYPFPGIPDGNGIQLPEGYQPQVPSQGSGGATQPRGYRPVSQQLPDQNVAYGTSSRDYGASSQRPVYKPDSGPQGQSTKQPGFGVRQDFNPFEEEPTNQVGSTTFVRNQYWPTTLQSPSYQGTYDQDPDEVTRTPGSELPAAGGSSSCSGEGFFPILNDCTHFYRCVPSGRGFSKVVFSCGPGTVWDSDMNTCNHPWAVHRPDCKVGA